MRYIILALYTLHSPTHLVVILQLHELLEPLEAAGHVGGGLLMLRGGRQRQRRRPHAPVLLLLLQLRPEAAAAPAAAAGEHRHGGTLIAWKKSFGREK